MTGAKTPSIFQYDYKVYRMVDDSAVSSTASLMELSMQLHWGNCVDSFKAVVLGLPQWWEDMLREIYWSWKGAVSLESITELGGCVWRDTQAWKGWGTLVWVDSTQTQTISGVWLGSVFE